MEQGQKDHFALIERTVMDVDFRNRLLEDPEGTISAEGYDVPEDLLTQVKSMDRGALEAAISELNHQVGTRKAAA